MCFFNLWQNKNVFLWQFLVSFNDRSLTHRKQVFVQLWWRRAFTELIHRHQYWCWESGCGECDVQSEPMEPAFVLGMKENPSMKKCGHSVYSDWAQHWVCFSLFDEDSLQEKTSGCDFRLSLRTEKLLAVSVSLKHLCSLWDLTKITRTNTKCSFYTLISFIRGTKAFQTSLPCDVIAS